MPHIKNSHEQYSKNRLLSDDFYYNQWMNNGQWSVL